MAQQTPDQTQSAPRAGEKPRSSGGGPPDSRQALAKTTQIIWLVTGVLQALIGIRVLLRLLAANPQAGFAQLIYGITAVFLVPFTGLFDDPAANGSVLELSSLVAMLVYALFAWGVIRVMWVTFGETPTDGGGPGATG